MRTRGVSTRPLAVILSHTLVLMAALAAPVGAQTFQDSFNGALTNTTGVGANNCSRLGGPAGTGGPFGPQLGAICNPAFINGATTSSGSLSVDARGQGEQEVLLRRLRERQAGTAASADAPGGLGGLGVFATTAYQTFDKDVTRFEPGYSRDTWGGTIGADYFLFGGKGLIGVAFGYFHQDGAFDSKGGNFDTDAYGPTFYGSILVYPNLFVDLYAGYTRRDYTINRRYSFAMNGGPQIPSAIAHGDTHGDEAKLGVNTGYDFHFGSLTVGPRFGLNWKENHIHSYSETGGIGLELAYDDQHQTSFTSNLGAFASMAFSTGIGVFVPQATWEWVHEFLNDQRVTYFHFVQDLGQRRFRFQNDPPDRDYFNASLGLTLVLPNGLAPFVNVSQFFGYNNQSSTTVTAGLRFSF